MATGQIEPPCYKALVEVEDLAFLERPDGFFLKPFKKSLRTLTVRGRSALGTIIWSPLKEDMGMALIFDLVKTEPIADM
jgi:hypothetical protein